MECYEGRQTLTRPSLALPGEMSAGAHPSGDPPSLTLNDEWLRHVAKRQEEQQGHWQDYTQCNNVSSILFLEGRGEEGAATWP